MKNSKNIDIRMYVSFTGSIVLPSNEARWSK